MVLENMQRLVPGVDVGMDGVEEHMQLEDVAGEEVGHELGFLE